MIRAVLTSWLLLVAGLAWSPAVRGASVVRDLPAHFRPDTAVTVSLATAPDPGTRVQAVEDHVPTGWTVAVLSHGGVFDTVNRVVKWGPFLDATARSLTYQATPSAAVTGTVEFTGSARFDGAALNVTGDQTTTRFPGTLTRTQPDFYQPGVALAVTLNAAPAGDVLAWAVEERVPAGWSVGAITTGGLLDPGNRKIKWGPFFDPNPRTLGYVLTPPAAARATESLAAVARFDAAVVTAEAALPVEPSTLGRTVPASYLPGVPFQVTLLPQPAPHILVVTVEEQLPAGWIPAAVSAGGTFDAVNRRLKWGPFVGQSAVPGALSYRLTPPSGSSVPITLAARARFDEVEIVREQVVPRYLERPENRVTRLLPAFYAPGVGVTVSLEAVPVDIARVYAVEEGVPEGWSIGSISHGGGFDAVNRRVKWGPFLDDSATPRTLTYVATPPIGAREVGLFDGVARFDGAVTAVTGPAQLGPRPSTVVRSAPARYTPGVPLRVTLAVSPSPDVEVQALEERIPAGWTVGGLTDGGSFDARNRKVKWGPFTDAQLRNLSYILNPPPSVTGPAALEGVGTFDRGAVTVTGPAGLEHNAPPTAFPDTLTRRAGEPAKFLVTDLLANDFDPEADFLDVRELGAVSAQGVPLVLDWPWVLYVPASAIGEDTFTYTVSDPYGGTATATAQIRIIDPGTGLTRNILSIELLSEPVRTRINWVGIPGRLYRVQATDSLVAPVTWATIGTARAGVNGVYQFTDGTPSPSLRFYRALTP